MPFDTFSFILFFTVVLLLERLTPLGQVRKSLLLLLSWLFYAGWNPYFLPLLIITGSADWWLASQLQYGKAQHKRFWLLLSLLSNLSVLGFFKYRFFIAENLDALFATQLLAGLQAPGHIQWALPVGISFYTFQSMSYCIDAYRGKLPSDRVSWLDFSLYVGFFPQLVAGPIVRFNDFYPQLQAQKRADARALQTGFVLLLIGLFLKIVGADSIFGPVSDQAFAASAPSTGQAWLAAIAFSGQIFCDFAGYSTCAIGAARCLGFGLPENFAAPYSALGWSDFWRRWHISLSSWLRDYLYIPLGGNRFGALRTYVALSLTMLIGGLWHGAAWTFVLWGGMHGLFLVLERALRPIVAAGMLRVPTLQIPAVILGWAFTLFGVIIAWVFFRATSASQAFNYCHAMLSLGSTSLIAGWQTLAPAEKMAWLSFLVLIVCHLLQRRFRMQERFIEAPLWLLIPACAVLLSAIVLSPGNARAFIYFQF